MSNSKKHNNPHFASNIPRYFLYTAFQGFGFGLMLAIWVIYLQQRRGLSLAQAALIDVTFFVTVTLAEVPTGMVADAFGRKASIVVGAILLCIGTLAWTYAPTMPLIVFAYVVMAIGTTFLSGASEAFFYESLQVSGRSDDYTPQVGRASAIMIGALALGSLASGLLATIDLVSPLLVASLSYLVMLGIALAFKEPPSEGKSSEQSLNSYRKMLRQSLDLMRARPSMRYPMFYLALVPLAALMMETVFLQPQALSVGVPIAGVGAVAMAVQLTNVAGSTWSEWIRVRLGQGRLFYTAPVIIIASLIFLAGMQITPALLLIAVMSFVTAALHPILLNLIQQEVTGAIRATVLSIQSLMATLLGAIGQPTLGFIADKYGLPATYFTLAVCLSILIPFLLWRARHYFP
jgi:MFS family permease